MVSFRRICISKSLAFCLLAGALSASVGSAIAGESEASSQASSQASGQASTEASGSGSSEASRASSSEASVHPSSRAITQSASESGGLVGRPTVINRSNVGGEILQAAGQRPRSSAYSSRSRRIARKRPAHWKTQVWNQGTTKKTTH
jgi:hypothetical protein